MRRSLWELFYGWATVIALQGATIILIGRDAVTPMALVATIWTAVCVLVATLEWNHR